METHQLNHNGIQFLIQSAALGERIGKKVQEIISSESFLARFTRKLAHIPGYHKVLVRIDDHTIGSTLYFFSDDASSFIVFNFDMEGEYSDILVIKNIVTNPPESRTRGVGKKVLLDILMNMRGEKEIKKVIATQVQSNVDGFWEKCGFQKIPGLNSTNDFEYISDQNKG